MQEGALQQSRWSTKLHLQGLHSATTPLSNKGQMDRGDTVSLRKTTSESSAESMVNDYSFPIVDNEQHQGQMDRADALSLQTMTPESLAELMVNKPSSPGRFNRPTPKHTFKHQAVITSFVFLHDNIHVVSGSDDGGMRKWDCETGLLVGEPWGWQDRMIKSLALSPDGQTIACGRSNGSVERWNTNGEMIEGIWTGHSDWVRSLSWSPSGGHIASGSEDGTVLIRKAESGQVVVSAIETKQRWVWSVAYSPLGDRIASGGYETICIWDSHNGELLVGPIEGQGYTSVVWSLDGSKLYSTDVFAHVFDSTSGTELHRFELETFPISIALACVGNEGIAHLWHTVSHQPLGRPFHGTGILCSVSFSPDGQYLAYAGLNRKIVLWLVKDIAPELQIPSPSIVEVDAFGRTEYERNDICGDFFQSSEPSRPYAGDGSSRPSQHPHVSSTRRLLDVLIPSRFRKPESESIELQERPKRNFFAWHAGPRIVTVVSGRRKEFNVNARHQVRSTNAQPCQSSSAPPPATQPQSMPAIPQHPQPQPATHAAQAEPDYGCWVNFCLTLWCIPRRVISDVRPAAP